MTPRDQLIAAALGVALAAVPLVYASLKLLLTYVQLRQVQLDAAKAQQLHEAAKGAVYYAEEAAASGRASGGIAVLDKAKLAGDIVAEKFPKLDDDEVQIAVQSAVGELPGIGASGRKP